MLIKQKTLFSKEECNSIISGFYIKNNKDWSMDDRKYNSQSIHYSLETSWLFDRLRTFVETESNIEFRKIKTQIHFHTFKEGDWFGKHNDTRDSRVYGVGVLLNDNFKGGDFKLYNQNEIILDKVIGNTYIFDARIEHEIFPILGGERYSLLWFLQNEHIKLNTDKLL
jgi:hypothetical protein